MRIDWTVVGRDEVLRAIAAFDQLGAAEFYARHGFAPTTTYELVWEGRKYPPKALLGTAFEFATGLRRVFDSSPRFFACAGTGPESVARRRLRKP